MADETELVRIQVVKGTYRWGARFPGSPDVWYIGRSPCEAVGKLLLANKDVLGLLVSGFVAEGEHFVPRAESAHPFQQDIFLAEVLRVQSLPPLWTVGPGGRDRYYAVTHPRHVKRGQGAA